MMKQTRAILLAIALCIALSFAVATAEELPIRVDEKTSTASVDELYVMARSAGWPVCQWKVEDHEPIEEMHFQPNFVTAQADVSNQRAITVSELVVYYDETTFNTGVKECVVKPYSYGFGFMPYLEGEAYNPSREGYDEELGIYDFYLFIRPDVADARTYVEYAADSMELFTYSLVGLQKGITSVGDLKNADGNVLDKNNAVMTLGTTIEVTVGKYVADLEVPVVERFVNAQNLHEMTPSYLLAGPATECDGRTHQQYTAKARSHRGWQWCGYRLF